MKILLMSISIIIPTAIATWFLLDEFVYGHKTQIKKLWEEILQYVDMAGKINETAEKVGAKTILAGASNSLKTKQDRAGKLINALLDYYYADTENEDEQEYVKNNRYEEK